MCDSKFIENPIYWCMAIKTLRWKKRDVFVDVKTEVDWKGLRRNVKGSPEQQSLEEDWAFSDVDLERRRCPSTNGLYEVGRDTVFR